MTEITPEERQLLMALAKHCHNFFLNSKTVVGVNAAMDLEDKIKQVYCAQDNQIEAAIEGKPVTVKEPISRDITTMRCEARQEGDEYYCATCGLRWDFAEDKPPTAKCLSST